MVTVVVPPPGGDLAVTVPPSAVTSSRTTAADVISEHLDDIDEGPTGLPPDFEAPRWFYLPPLCLTHSDRATSA